MLSPVQLLIDKRKPLFEFFRDRPNCRMQRRDAMKSRPHKLQPAALVLAIVSIAATVFPFIRAGAGPLPPRDRTTVREESASQPITSAVNRTPRSLPLGFEANRGQAEADVKFVGRGPGFGLLLKPGEAEFALKKREPAFVGSATADAKP